MSPKFIFWISLIWSNTTIIMLYHYLPMYAALEFGIAITLFNALFTYALLKANQSNEGDDNDE
jgi:hypothetical protein